MHTLFMRLALIRPPSTQLGGARYPLRIAHRPRVSSSMSLQISTDPAALDLVMIHRYLAEESYWAKGIPRAVLDKALTHSLCFGGYLGTQQVAFGRLVTDRATTAHLKDVFVLPPYRKRGYGLALMRAIMAHRDLQTVTMTLATADAHALYARFGFTPHSNSQSAMIRPGRFLTPTGVTPEESHS